MTKKPAREIFIAEFSFVDLRFNPSEHIMWFYAPRTDLSVYQEEGFGSITGIQLQDYVVSVSLARKNGSLQQINEKYLSADDSLCMLSGVLKEKL